MLFRTAIMLILIDLALGLGLLALGLGLATEVIAEPPARSARAGPVKYYDPLL